MGYQLIRDTAIFKPENIRWVFDASKVSKQQVIDAFTNVIKGDAYLLTSWGGKGADQKVIGSMLDKVIDVF